MDLRNLHTMQRLYTMGDLLRIVGGLSIHIYNLSVDQRPYTDRLSTSIDRSYIVFRSSLHVKTTYRHMMGNRTPGSVYTQWAIYCEDRLSTYKPVSYTHLRAHET